MAAVERLEIALAEARNPWSEVDTAAVERDLADLISLIRRYPFDFALDRVEAAKTYRWLGQSEEAMSVLEEGVGEAPFLAEFVGYALTYEGKDAAAELWYRRAFETTYRSVRDSIIATPLPGQELYTESWFRLIWLGYGSEAALDSLATLAPESADSRHVRLTACYVRLGQPRDWVETIWEDVSVGVAEQDFTPLDSCRFGL